MSYNFIKYKEQKTDDLFEFLGFQEAMKQTKSNNSVSNISNDLILNGNYSNTADLVSDLVNIQFDRNKNKSR